MTLSISITFQGMPPSPALRSDIEERAHKLTRFEPRLQTCQVTVSHSEHRHRQGNRYQVHVKLTLPGADIEAGRTPRGNYSHEDPYVAAHETFDALRRQLEDFVRIRRGDTKAHGPDRTSSSRS